MVRVYPRAMQDTSTSTPASVAGAHARDRHPASGRARCAGALLVLAALAGCATSVHGPSAVAQDRTPQPARTFTTAPRPDPPRGATAMHHGAARPAAVPPRLSIPGAMPDGDSLLLVSLDGFRADYLDLGITPNLARLAAGGVRAQWMAPSYPVLTFPNHYTLVTGLLPDHQGIVHNTMQDAALGGFKVSDRMAVGDSRWWGGEPIWVGAAKAGMPSAALFWPGSEADIAGLRPTRWLPFDDGMPLAARVDLMARWLSEDMSTRPRIAVMYLETVDEAAHAHGPHSPEAHAAVRALDAALGRLLGALESSGRRPHVNLVVVSDHGMATVPPGQVVAVEDMVVLDEAAVVTVGQVIGIAPRAGYEATVTQRLLGAHAQYDCWRKSELPPRWRYGSHPRIPPIVCQMHEGWDALARTSIAARPLHDRGSHGYDPGSPQLRALFVAQGPAFRAGATLAPFANVDVYPLLARLVGIEVAPNDGDMRTLTPALRVVPAPAPTGR